MQVIALVVLRVTVCIPSSPIKHEKIRKFRNLQLADTEYQQPWEIDILLGADVTLRLLKKRLIRSTANGPVAQLTDLGWVIG